MIIPGQRNASRLPSESWRGYQEPLAARFCAYQAYQE
jgi:hypothetical protein